MVVFALSFVLTLQNYVIKHICATFLEIFFNLFSSECNRFCVLNACFGLILLNYFYLFASFCVKMLEMM